VAAFLCFLGMQMVRMVVISTKAAVKYVPAIVDFVKSASQPKKCGPTNLPRFPIELIKAMPTAAVASPSRAVGQAQRTAAKLKIPLAAKLFWLSLSPIGIPVNEKSKRPPHLIPAAADHFFLPRAASLK